MPKKTYDQLVTENKKIKDLMTHTAEEYNKGCDDRYKLQQENDKLKAKIDDLEGRLEDVDHIAGEWEDQVEELKEEIEKLKERKVRKLDSESHQKKGDYIMKFEEEIRKLKNKLEELGKRNCILQEQMDKEHVRYMDEVSNRSDDLCEIAKALGIEWHGEIKDIMTTITSLKKSNEQKTKIIRKARKQAQDLLKGDNE